MSNVSWTPMQEQAIKTDGKSLIVSAAAGSGKTAVLVERIINKICSVDKPVRIDRMLIVTFTRAAANEMRERISKSLDERIKSDPTNKYLLRQKMMLPLAEICTMDQFFNSLVKENFNKLSITPDFRILDESESSLISNEAVTEVLEEYYAESDDNFNRLLQIIGCEKNDDALAAAIKKFARNSDAYPNPDEWLENIKAVYSRYEKPQDTNFGSIILKEISDCCKYALSLNSKAQSYVEGCEELEKVYIVLQEDKEKITDIINLCENKDWNNLKNTIEALTFQRFPTISGEAKDRPEKKYAKLFRDRMKGITDNIKTVIAADEKEYCDDIELLKPVVEKFIEIVVEYKKCFLQKKNSDNCYDFSDIVHLTLELLVKDGKPTEAALELREKYDEILIDEYQDTNEAQDKIFSSLSKEERNFFLVGDVKQSIYRFRLAMPQVFLGRISEWQKEECDYAEYISLDSNFRSRAEILNAVNYIFERVMSVDAGDIVYDETQSLKAGANCYSNSDEQCVELMMLDKKSMPEDYSEAQMIADKIESILKDTQVYDKKLESMRPAEFKDICILLRRKKLGAMISKELKKREIPSYYEEDDGFFGNVEISVMLSLLSVINNPLQDIPLVSVLMSPIFGFTADEIAQLRIDLKKGNLYYSVKKSESEKCKYFIKKYNEYRSLSTVVSVRELIRTVYEDSGYLSVVTSLNNGEVRRLNLLLLLDYASSYEEYGQSGLSGFLRYIDRMKENDSDFKPAGNVSEYANVIRIMTVHKSKGLEFPIVFLADCARGKNNRNDNLIIHEKIGMGVKISDRKTFRKYSTVPYEAAKILSTKSDCSEELRILYVALTRARERLIFTSEVSNAENFIAKTACDCISKDINPVAVNRSQSYIELLIKVFMRHPDAKLLRDIADYDGDTDASSDFKLNIEIINNADSLKSCEESTVYEEKADVDYDLLDKIKEKTAFAYQYGELAGCATKIAASSFNKLNDMKYFANAVPKFYRSDSLTAAEKGTAVHRFMETCDFSNAAENIYLEKERLLSLKKLTQQQADSLDLEMIGKFFSSSLFNRIVNSEKVVREQKFRISVPVNIAFPEIEKDFTDESIIVQGIIDCAFFENGRIVVLDYKTDNVNDLDELVQSYHRQLEIYKMACEQIFSAEVKEMLLYSFKLGEETPINL